MYYQRRILYQRILNENDIVTHNNQTYRKIRSFEYIRQHPVRQPVTPDRLFLSLFRPLIKHVSQPDTHRITGFVTPRQRSLRKQERLFHTVTELLISHR